MAAALALALTLASAAAPPVVAVEAPTPVLRGALALALVDDGAVVVPVAADASVTLRVLADGSGLQLASIGASERAATVAAGTPALVELEAVNRALALVRATPARAAEPAAAVFLDVDDRAQAAVGAGARLAELLAAALLDAGAPLADTTLAVERLCVVATASELSLSWGTTSTRCDGRQMGVARAGMSPTGVIGDALRLRGAAAPARPWRSGGDAVPGEGSVAVATSPGRLAAARAPGSASAVAASAPDAPPTGPVTSPAAQPAAVTSVVGPSRSSSSASSPSSPAAEGHAGKTAPPGAAPSPSPGGTAAATVAPQPSAANAGGPSLDVRLGALGRPLAVDPLLDVQLTWPLWRAQGVGPVGWASFTGALEPLPLAEVSLAGGVGGVWRVADELRLSAALVAGGSAHGWRYAGNDAGVAFDALLAAPLTLAWQPGPFGASLALTPGAVTRGRSHQIQGEVAWQRGAIFLGISAGLTWDIPTAGGPVENSVGSPRGEGDG